MAHFKKKKRYLLRYQIPPIAPRDNTNIYFNFPKVDENGVRIGENFGFCDPGCLTHEESFTWKRDKTIKMILQYDKTDLLDLQLYGLQLYGYLVAGILIFSLPLTTFLPAIGKIMVSSDFLI